MLGGGRGESPQHLAAKERVAKILIALLWNAVYELSAPQITELGLRGYQFDVFAWKKFRAGSSIVIKLAIEIDGKVGHSSEYATKVKMPLRDRSSVQNRGVFTIRLKTAWVVGAKKMSDATLIAEMEYQLKENYGVVIRLE